MQASDGLRNGVARGACQSAFRHGRDMVNARKRRRGSCTRSRPGYCDRRTIQPLMEGAWATPSVEVAFVDMRAQKQKARSVDTERACAY
jgi:hypothetical protein